jgi:DNA-binding transcriptional MerR regulator
MLSQRFMYTGVALPSARTPVDVRVAARVQWNYALWCDRPPRRQGTGVMSAEPKEGRFSAGQVARVTGVTLRQLDYWATTGFLPPSGGTHGGLPGKGHDRQYTFEDLIRLRTVGELRRQGVPLQVIRKALDRLQQFTGDPLRELKLVAVAGDVYVCRSREELERATDGQLAFTVLDVGAMLRRLEGQIATLWPKAAQVSRRTLVAAAG